MEAAMQSYEICESEEFLKIVNNRDANGLRQFLETKRDYENSVKFPSVNQLKFLYDKSVNSITIYLNVNGDPYHGVLSLILWEYRMLNDYEKNALDTIGRLVKKLSNKKVPNLYQASKTGEPLVLVSPLRDLFLWALLTDLNEELTVVIWKNLEGDHVVNAVVAFTVLKSMAEILRRRSFTFPPIDDSIPPAPKTVEEECQNKFRIFDKSEDLLQKANSYGSKSDKMLKKCLDDNSHQLSYLLVRELPQWQNKSLFSIKYGNNEDDLILKSFDKDILKLAKQRLKETWYKNMKTDTKWWFILLGIFLPLICLNHITFNNNFKLFRTKNRFSFEYYFDEYFEKKGNKFLPYNYYQFYFAPVVKFFMHTMSFLVFLTLFSIFLVTDFYPDKISIYECLVWTWAATMYLDECRQILEIDTPSFRRKFKEYFRDNWNKYDQLCYCGLLIATICRCLQSSQSFEAARIVYAITLVIFMLRILQYFYFSQRFGPQVVMIFRLLRDLPFFFFVFAVFIFAYGICARALLYPNSPLTWLLLFEIIASPYFAIYGQFTDLDAQLSGQCVNVTSYVIGNGVPMCSDSAIFLFSVYIFIATILLINLLIAMMNTTYTKEGDNSEAIWLVNRFSIMQEYMKKSWLVPPLIILSHISKIILFVWVKCKTPNKTNADGEHQYNVIQLKCLEERLTKMEMKAVEEVSKVEPDKESDLQCLIQKSIRSNRQERVIVVPNKRYKCKHKFHYCMANKRYRRCGKTLKV